MVPPTADALPSRGEHDDSANTVADGEPVERPGIVSLPPVLKTNPYQRLLYDCLEDNGLKLERIDRLSLGRLWSARRRVGWLHFHWPQVYYQDERFGGHAGWLRLGLFSARLAGARALGYRIAWTVHQVYPHESDDHRLDRTAGRVWRSAAMS